MDSQSAWILFRKTLKWIVRVVAAVVVLTFALVGTLLLVMWWEHRTGVTLPAPTGHFAVGRTTFAWTNDAETDDLAPVSGTKRQVLAWVWYPASHSNADVPAEYVFPLWRAAMAARGGVFMKRFFKRDLSVVRTHSWSDAVVSPEQRAYPVVLLRAGGGAPTTDFTTLAEDLASHGYFVVGFDAPYLSGLVVLPDGRVVTQSPASNVENAGGNLADPLIGKTADDMDLRHQVPRGSVAAAEWGSGRKVRQPAGPAASRHLRPFLRRRDGVRILSPGFPVQGGGRS